MTARATQSILVAAAVLLAAAPLNSPAADSVHRVDVRIDPATLSWERFADGVGIRLEGAAPAGVPGAPDVPLLPVTVIPPPGTRLAGVEVVDVETSPLTAPAPVRRVPVPDGAVAPRVDPTTGPPVVRTPGGYLRGQRLDALVISPVRRTAGGGWSLAERIRLALRFEPDAAGDVVRPLRGPAGLAGTTPPGRLVDLSGDRPGSLRPRSTFAEASESTSGAPYDPRFRPSIDGSPVAYVIITNEAMAAEFQRLADWHTREGEPAVVRTVEWISGAYSGVDLQQKIRRFIRDAVVHWGTEWVVLGGDAPVIPVRYGLTTYMFRDGSEIPTDLYYQCLDGTWNLNGNAEYGEADITRPNRVDDADLIPDVWLARMPAATPDEAATLVNKTIAYQTRPPVDADYPSSILLLAEVLFPSDWAEGDTVVYDGADLAQEVAGELPASMAVTRLYENYTDFPGAEPESLTAVQREIGRGYGIVHHVGHGYINNMSVGIGGRSLVYGDADDAENGDRTFLLYAINCASAAVDYDCIDEHYLRNPHGGAVATVGATRSLYPGTNHFYDLKFYHLVFSALPDEGQDLDRLGKGTAVAKAAFVPLSAYDNSHRWTQFTLTCLGDPALRIWSATPESLRVTAPDAIVAGERTVTVAVRTAGTPEAGATVTLWKTGETYATGVTDAAGEARLTVRPRTQGELSLTVSARNRLPFLGAIGVTGADGPLPTLDAVTVDDPAEGGGNGNGSLEAGESARVVFTLRNEGTAGLTGMVVAAPAAVGPVSLGAPEEAPGSLGPGTSGDFAFAATVDPGGEDFTTADLMLTVSADQGTWSVPAALRVGAPDPAIYDLKVTEISGNGNGVPEPGETVTVEPAVLNRGGGATLPLHGVLTVEGGTAGIESGETDYPVIASGQVAEPEAPFRVALSDPVSSLALRFTLSDAGRTRLEQTLDLVPPTPPDGVTARGLASSIVVSWSASPDSDVVRYVVSRSEDPAGPAPFARINGFEPDAFLYHTDDGYQTFAVRYYRVQAQDRSGNLSPPSAPVRGTTSLELFPSFPMEAEVGTQSSPTVADVDGDGVLDVFTGREQVYAFHADGSELRNGDGQARTLGVWSDAQFDDPERRGFMASPSIGDLDGDGRLEVVDVSFTEGKLYVWDSLGQVRPGWPRTPVQGTASAMASPVLADVTGDGRLEILVQAGQALYAFEPDGSEVADGDHDPATTGILYSHGRAASYGTPAAADLDGDGKAEIVLPVRGTSGAHPTDGELIVLRGDGSVLPGWPIHFGGAISSSPALADLDGNGSIDIIAATGSDSLEVFDVTGHRLPGWPKRLLMDQDVMSSPAVADVDGDGSLDVACVSGEGNAYLWHADGTPFDGFPIRFGDAQGNRISARGSPTLANLDADDDLEMVFGNNQGWVVGLNPDGTYLEGFPLKVDAAVDGGVLVTDLNGDGVNELCFSGYDPRIYLYETAGRVTANPGWTMFHHDPRHTGYVGTPTVEARTPRLTLALLQTPEAPESAVAYLVSTRALGGLPGLTLDGSSIDVAEADRARRLYRAAVALTAGSHRLAATAITVDGVPGSTERDYDVVVGPTPGAWVEGVQSGVGILAGGAVPSPMLLERLAADERVDAAYAPPGDGVRVRVGSPGPAPRGTRLALDVPRAWSGASVFRWDGASWRGETVVGFRSGRVTASVTGFGWFRLAPGPGVEPRAAITLVPPAPNPFKGATRVAFTLSVPGRARVEVFDLRGARVRRLAEGSFPAGETVLSWDGRDDFGRGVAPGVYFVRARGGSSTASAKIVRLSGGERP
jgi:hypothetical protein